MQEVYVEVGQQVEEGQRIGFMGATGTAYGGHLHFEVRRCNEPIDPTPYFNGQRMVELMPTPVEENKEVDQLRVNCDDTMNVRKENTTHSESLGFAKTGYYNILQKSENDGNIWYEVEEGRWVALVPPFSEYVPKTQETAQNQEKGQNNINTLPNTKNPEKDTNNDEIELINRDKSNPLVEFIKFIIELIKKIIERGNGDVKQ